jgi:basic amino acid/polyamine antiporter, APA family
MNIVYIGFQLCCLCLYVANKPFSKHVKTSDNKLLKILGVGFGIAVTIGGTIGTGILRKPGTVAAQLGDVRLIMLVWILISIYAFFGVLCTLELGISIPRAGAWYVYAHRAFGGYIAFVVGICTWLGTAFAMGFSAYTLSEYAALLLPQLEPYIRLIAVVLLIFLALFHSIGVEVAGKSQEIITSLKSIGLIIFIVLCFVYGQDVSHTQVANTTQKAIGGASIASFIIALQSVFYAFDGWNTAAYFTEENTDPAKNLPKAMISGLLLVVAIYLLVNWAILNVLTIEELAQSKLAAADAIKVIFGERSGKVVTFFLMLSIFGMLNAQIMFAPRGLYSMSKDKIFLAIGAKVNAGGTPIVSMLTTASASILLIMSGKEICGRLSDVATFFFVMGYVSAFASLIRLRQVAPSLPRPYKVWGYPYMPYFMLIASLAFLVGAVVQDLPSSQYALIFLVVSYPLYRGIKYLNGV